MTAFVSSPFLILEVVEQDWTLKSIRSPTLAIKPRGVEMQRPVRAPLLSTMLRMLCFRITIFDHLRKTRINL